MIEVVRLQQIKILKSTGRSNQWVTGTVNNQIVPSIRIMEARRQVVGHVVFGILKKVATLLPESENCYFDNRRGPQKWEICLQARHV
jgi:hypothetical protein